MSLLCFGVIAEANFEFASNRPNDEEWQAHIFQILMALEIPIILIFVTTGWRSFPRILPVLAAQLVLWFGAFAMVALFHL
jgi:hypothetical protein